MGPSDYELQFQNHNLKIVYQAPSNGVAHLLARKAKDVQESITWTHTMPPDVHSLILKDLQ